MVMVPEAILQRRLTLDDYLGFPDDQRYEIIEGVLYVAPRARSPHQVAAGNFTFELIGHVQRPGLGVVVPDADLIVDADGTYVAPDIMVFLGQNAAGIVSPALISTIPDLVVEVLSPTSVDYDQRTKRDTYQRLRVRHYWIADPGGRLVLELVLGADGRYQERVVRAPEAFVPALFPELRIDLTRAFAFS
jgi:Uma2 family endonuclease